MHTTVRDVRLRSVALAAAALGPWLGSGCGSEPGPPRVPVAGEVRLDGAPLPSGTITFAPVDGNAGAFGEVKDGAFRFGAADGPSPGLHTVEVVAVRPTGRKVASPDLPGETEDEARNVIPPRYNARTELRAEVRPGSENTFRFDLTSRTRSRPATRR